MAGKGGKKKRKAAVKAKKAAVREKAEPVMRLGIPEKAGELEAPERTVLLEEPAMEMPPPAVETPADGAERLKLYAAGALVVLAIAVGAYIFLFSSAGETDFRHGAEVNMETFADILSNSGTVYLVMDLRGADNSSVEQNIMQCGVDFASSRGLVGKTLNVYSITEEECIDMDGSYPVSQCVQEAETGLVILVRQGNESRFYNNMMDVGIGANYTLNTCSINVK